MTEEPLLEIDELEKHFKRSASMVESVRNRLTGDQKDPIRAVDGVNLTLGKNEVKGIIGESGCGKTTLLKTLMGLHQPTNGEIRFKGKRLSGFSKADWKNYRQDVQFIFQNPFDSMNPKLTVREALREPLDVHDVADKEEKVYRVLERVQLHPPEQYLDRYEGQLSGGEKQRVAIARGLILEPDVLLADEPVSMLDVSTQAAILRLLNELSEEYELAVLYISHDLSTVSYICDAISVMYLGKLVETAPTERLLDNPSHPYSQGLINAIPIPNPHNDRERVNISGRPPNPNNLPSGCRFRDRCPEAMDICKEDPLETAVGSDHTTKCHLYYDHTELSETATSETPAGQPTTGESDD